MIDGREKLLRELELALAPELAKGGKGGRTNWGGLKLAVEVVTCDELEESLSERS